MSHKCTSVSLWPELTHLVCRLHFYNIPVTDNFTAPIHPLNIIRSHYQSGDFIVLKLDIDKSDLESAIMKEIESDPALKEMIAEISYEQHYNHPGDHRP